MAARAALVVGDAPRAAVEVDDVVSCGHAVHAAAEMASVRHDDEESVNGQKVYFKHKKKEEEKKGKILIYICRKRSSE